MTSFTATYSPDDNKLRLYASTRLDSELYDRVKAAGFKWAPKQELFVAPAWTPGREDLLIELAGEIEDEDRSLVDRAEERADRFEDYSGKRAADAERAHKVVAAIADNIPLGQPILVGHHSERRARKDAERIESGMRKAVKMWDTSKYWEDRAAGALRHARYKELPTVRARRIKRIEADKRKSERSRKDAETCLQVWANIAGMTDPAEQLRAAVAFANTVDHYGVTLPNGERVWSAWGALQDGTLTPADVAEQRAAKLPNNIARCDRWIAHYDNRLIYERAMLAEAGLAVDRFAFAKGGQVLYRGEWVAILRVNRGANGSVNTLTCKAPKIFTFQDTCRVSVEKVSDYRAPEAGDVEKARKAAKLPPICNYPGEGFREMTDAEWRAAMKRKWSDFSYIARIKATPEAGAHRRRRMPVPGKMWESQPVFITDAKRIDPPKPEPTPPTTPEPADDDQATDQAPLVVVSVESQTADPCAESRTRAPVESMAAPVAPPAPSPVESPADDPAAAFEAMRQRLRKTHAAESHEKGADTMPTPPDENRGVTILPPDDAATESRAERFEAMRRSLAGGVKVVSVKDLFLTPVALAARVVEEVGLRGGDRLLEPSAGTGRLIDAAVLSDWEWSGEIVAVENNAALASALKMKYDAVRVVEADFLECTRELGTFDRIVMNPPFSGQDDIRHVLHAAKFLAPGGRLVAIMSAGVTFRQDRLATDFRQFVESRGGVIEPLPADSFKEAGTSVNTALVTIEG